MTGGPALPEAIRARLTREGEVVRARLAEFAAVPSEEWFYECCFCLLTPQSSAVHADAVVRELKRLEFQRDGGDVLTVLRNPAMYIRFHNVKHARLHRLRDQWDNVKTVIMGEFPSAIERRNTLARTVDGYGLKEASHLLRNIGFRGLAIVDRHFLTNLVRCGLFPTAPSVSSSSAYLAVERAYLDFCRAQRVDPDELDLVFWSEETGFILK